MKLVKKPMAARKQRRKLTAEFKAKFALTALSDDKTMAELCAQFNVRPNEVGEWKKQLVARATEEFRGSEGFGAEQRGHVSSGIRGLKSWHQQRVDVIDRCSKRIFCHF